MKIRFTRSKGTLVFSILLFVTICILCIACFQSIAGQNVEYASDESYSWIRMVNGRTVTQHFTARYSDITGMIIRFDNTREQCGQFNFTITDDATGEVIYHNSYVLSGQPEQCEMLITPHEVPGLEFEKRGEYTLTIVAEHTKSTIADAPMIRLFKYEGKWDGYFGDCMNELSVRTGQSCVSIIYHYYDYPGVVLLISAGLVLCVVAAFDLKFKERHAVIQARRDKRTAKLSRTNNPVKRILIRIGKPEIIKFLKYAFAALTPFFTFLIFENATGYLQTMKPYGWFWNIAIFYAIYLAGVTITGRMRGFSMGCEIFFACYGLMHSFVETFKGAPIMAYDLRAMGTALAVADTYTWDFTFRQISAIIFFWVLLLVTSKIYWRKIKGKTRIISMSAGTVISVAFICVLIFTDLLEYNGITVRYWRLTESYQKQGYLLNTCSSIGDMIIHAPEGYDSDVLREAITDDGHGGNEEVTQPTNIIVIMNESYGDLRYINEFSSSESVYTTIDALAERDDVFYTRLHVPVYGSGTSTSEYMVLTGNNMAFLPGGTSPYYLYSGENEYGLASTLNAQGYRTVAMHPNLADNWDRENVYYNYMGFDEFYSIDDYSGYDTLRDYVSDQGDYDRLIDLYEDKEEGEPLFVFNVTMQNHGGYTYTGYNFNQDVTYYGNDYYQKANQYLSCLKQSDIALNNLIEYFSNVSEPTMIVFFGDHQASLGSAFYSDLLGSNIEALSAEDSEVRYETPAFIWTNYNADLSAYQDITDMSANYLGAVVLEAAGLELTEYQQMLIEQLREMPVVGRMGCINADGEFMTYDEIRSGSGTAHDIINNYEAWQYNYIFGKNDRVDEVFTIGDVTGTAAAETETSD